jgi:hypothetical protein
MRRSSAITILIVTLWLPLAPKLLRMSQRMLAPLLVNTVRLAGTLDLHLNIIVATSVIFLTP